MKKIFHENSDSEKTLRKLAMSELHSDYVSSMQGVRRYGVRQSQFKVCEWKPKGMQIIGNPKLYADIQVGQMALKSI